MAQLTATGVTELASGEFTLVDGQSVTLNLFAAAGADLFGCTAVVQLKASNGEFYDIGILDKATKSQVLTGAGVYRVLRKGAAVSFGVDKT